MEIIKNVESLSLNKDFFGWTNVLEVERNTFKTIFYYYNDIDMVKFGQTLIKVVLIRNDFLRKYKSAYNGDDKLGWSRSGLFYSVLNLLSGFS